MEIKIELTESDIRWNIIKITPYRELFPKGGSYIEIECNGITTFHKIPSGGTYISGMTALHRVNNAGVGMMVALIPMVEKKRYRIEYGGCCDDEQTGKNAKESLSEKIEFAKVLLFENSWAFYKNETNIRTEIVDPLLKAIGWDFPNRIQREAVCRSGGNVDYALFDDHHYCMLIETKSIFSKLDKAQQQMSHYLSDKRFEKCIGVITDGVIWKVIDNDEGHNVLANISIKDERFVDFLSALRFDNIDVDEIKKIGINDTTDYYDLQQIIIKDINTCKMAYNGINQSDVLRGFVIDNFEYVLELQNKGCFRVTVVSNDYNDFRDKTRDAVRDNYYPYNARNYYITRDHSTLLKAMIIQQTINSFGLPYRIDF